MSPENSVLDILYSKTGFGVFDGGLATEVERRGASIKDSLWSAVCLLDKDLSELVKQVRIAELYIMSSSYNLMYGERCIWIISWLEQMLEPLCLIRWKPCQYSRTINEKYVLLFFNVKLLCCFAKGYTPRICSERDK